MQYVKKKKISKTKGGVRFCFQIFLEMFQHIFWGVEIKTFFKLCLFCKYFEDENKNKKWWQWFFLFILKEMKKQIKVIFSFPFSFLKLYHLIHIFIKHTPNIIHFFLVPKSIYLKKIITKHNSKTISASYLKYFSSLFSFWKQNHF